MSEPYAFRDFRNDTEELEATVSELRRVDHSVTTTLAGQDVLVTTNALAHSVAQRLQTAGLLDGPWLKVGSRHGYVWAIPVNAEVPLAIEKWSVQDAMATTAWLRVDEDKLWKATE